MLWLALSLLLALGMAVKSAFVKRVAASLDAYAIAWGYSAIGALTLLPLVIAAGVPELASEFWLVLAIDTLLLLVARLLYVEALAEADLSLVLPLLTFTPVFLLITSPIMIGEVPSALGALGIVAIVVGAYLLNLSDREHGLLAPLRSLVEERGARFMLGTALIYSVSANMDRLGIEAASPLFWGFAINLSVALVMLPGLFRGGRLRALTTARGRGSLLAAGVVSGATIAVQMFALTLTLVAYVNAVKRTSVLFGVVIGALVFGESGWRERLVAAAVMVVGVILIVLG